MPDPMETLAIENVVASAALDQELALATLADDLDGVTYTPEQFSGIIYRLQDPKATVLIFRSGKLVCTGAQSQAEMQTAIERAVNAIESLGVDVPDELSITVQNIVVSGDLGCTLNLNAIAIGLGLEAVEYEPEQFPGLVYRVDDPEVVVLLFGSGKLVITGGTDVEEANQAIEYVSVRLAELGLLGV